MEGFIDMVKLLREEGADVAARDNGGRTPEDLAEEERHAGVARFLRTLEEIDGLVRRKLDFDSGKRHEQ